MKVLQLILQVEVADGGLKKAKSMLAIEVPRIVVDSATGIMVGFAVEEIDPAGGPPEGAGGDSFPVGKSLRDVPTPYGALPQPTDEELRQTREDHPTADGRWVTANAVAARDRADQVAGIPLTGTPERETYDLEHSLGNRPELVVDSEETGGTDGDD